MRTRDFVLGRSNPYFSTGPVINSTGGPHLGPGMAWPMGIIMLIMTSDDDNEIVTSLKMLMGSTSGLGLIHESVNSFDDTNWTRSWYITSFIIGKSLNDLPKKTSVSYIFFLGLPGRMGYLARCSSISPRENQRYCNAVSRNKT